MICERPLILFSSQNDNRKLGQDAAQYDAWQQLKIFQQQQLQKHHSDGNSGTSQSDTNSPSPIDQTSQNYPTIDRAAGLNMRCGQETLEFPKSNVPPTAIATRTNMPVPLLRVSHYDKAGNHCPWEISRGFLVCAALK